MRLLTGSAVFESISEIQPHSVAVAYFGKSWRALLADRLPSRFLVAPILGSDPDAIRDAMEALGASNVGFLDQLHAKVFIGEYECVLGSANLSHNAAHYLVEACIRSDSAELKQKLATWFDELFTQSESKYPDLVSKFDRLDKLDRETRLARRNRASAENTEFGGETRSVPSLHSFLQSRVGDMLNTLHIVWYSEDRVLELDSSAESKHFPGEEGMEHFADYSSLIESDKRCISENDWMLVWRAGADGLPRKGKSKTPWPMSWIFVDRLIPRMISADEKPYTLLAGELKKSGHNGRLQPPFELDEATRRGLVEALSDERYRAFRPTGGDFSANGKRAWSLRQCAEKKYDLLRSALQKCQSIA